MSRRIGTGGSHFGGSTSPRGASGNFGGSSGSFNGGSGHGSSRGSRRSRTSVHVRIGGGHYHHGPHYGSAAPGWTIWLFLAFFIAFFSIPFFAMSATCSRSIGVIEDDFFYYRNMVSSAKAGQKEIIDATITGIYKNTDAGKWYIEYTLIDDDSLLSQNGAYLRTTYSMYTNEEIVKYNVGSKIAVVVDRMPINVNTDSMVMDFERFTLEDDGEYQQLVKQKGIYKTVAIVLISIGGALIILAGCLAIKDMKNPRVYNDGEEGSEDVSNNAPSTAKKTSYCPYCGCKAEEGRKKCEHCGANIK